MVLTGNNGVHVFAKTLMHTRYYSAIITNKIIENKFKIAKKRHEAIKNLKESNKAAFQKIKKKYEIIESCISNNIYVTVHPNQNVNPPNLDVQLQYTFSKT